MKFLLFISLLLTVNGAPQDYSHTTNIGSLDGLTQETIGDIFGNEDDQFGRVIGNGGYGSGGLIGNLETDVDNSLVESVIDTSNYTPDDFVEPEIGDFTDEATTEVDNTFKNCADYTESQGYECVPYYQCHNGSIITDGAGLIDIRNGFGVLSPEDSKCPGFLDVCCKDPDFIPPPPPKIKYAPKCGRRNQNGLGVRIQGFNEGESQFGEWPHMCAVLHEKVADEQEGGYSANDEPTTVNLYQCGGSLIAPGIILTAAHCVHKFKEQSSNLLVRCGEWDTQNQTEPYPHQDRKIESLNIHPLFNPGNLENDFALLFTEDDFVLASHIDTVCLPQVDELFDGQTCFATGWGKNKFGSSGEYQVVLKEIDLPVVDHNTCEKKLQQTRLGQKFKLHDSFLCAGGVSGKDTCKGDGGSPLVCPSKYDQDTYVQVGVVAWGIGCGENKTPGVYGSVSKALCWIDHVMTCRHGSNTGILNSYNGYPQDICQPYMDNIKDTLGNLPKHIYNNLIGDIDQCNVVWSEHEEPLEDVSDFGRDNYNGETNEHQINGYQVTSKTQETETDSIGSLETSDDAQNDIVSDPVYK